MAERKVIAGHAVRRVRRQAGLTQAAMAEALEISPSYLNLIERNQRPVSANLLVRLAQRFDFDARALAAGEPGGGAAAMRRRLADPLFADLEVDRSEVDEWLAAAPGGAEAFARVFDRGGAGSGTAADEGDTIARDVRRAIERWRNHFADLDAAAERLADELRLGSGDLAQAIAERLRVKHQLSVRILPVEVTPDMLKRVDLHARQLQLSEMLDAASRTFAMAERLGAEAGAEIEALVRGAELADRTAQRLFRRHVTAYFAAALMMPYARFLRACEGTGYDIELLQRRFGAGFEQVAHRLTTLQRVGARGLPFFMLRVDRAGQVSKRYAGASASPLVEGGLCPLWELFETFGRPGDLVRQLVETEDGARWFTLARTVQPQGARAGGVRGRFAIGLGLAASDAAALAAARGVDLAGGAVPVGLGCRACTRTNCPQRSAPPAGRARIVSDREAGVTPFAFAGD
ncbi:short-chain fatty acyl-CoA regulator family protein [Sphingomonas sp. S1-29]|uniref:helix-turn-helix domain-containing protein n=1 Tax=Sphingomonas sp. S1-29 TaxID=2991074 RepID=UPI0022403905|nr:helix-turn-helix transcriptional regulator [Sphingomonas sp. S1-29]UZK70437.1 short-chain fatty acyl-CoA regulator family protein [Sphingomonas sp. S1-29]